MTAPAVRTRALVRLFAVEVLNSQRYLPAMLAYLGLSAVANAAGSTDPLQDYALSAALLYPAAAWLTIVVLSCEPPEQRLMTVAAAGGWGRTLAGLVTTALMLDLALLVLPVSVGLLAPGGDSVATTLLIGLVAHLICGVAGTGLGLCFARPVVSAPGWAACGVLAVAMATALPGAVPPVGSVFEVLSGEHTAVAGTLAVSAVVAVLMVAGGSVLNYRLGRRRL